MDKENLRFGWGLGGSIESGWRLFLKVQSSKFKVQGSRLLNQFAPKVPNVGANLVFAPEMLGEPKVRPYEKSSIEEELISKVRIRRQIFETKGDRSFAPVPLRLSFRGP
jgi:hypothetical protein